MAAESQNFDNCNKNTNSHRLKKQLTNRLKKQLTNRLKKQLTNYHMYMPTHALKPQ